MDTQLKLEVKLMSCSKAVVKVYDSLPNQFTALTLCMEVRRVSKRMFMDGTILRRLREQREANRCPYKVIDTVNCVYAKN